MLIVQMSDPHFLPEGRFAFERVDLAGLLERAIDHINRLEPRPDAVLLSGDLTSDGDAPVYADLAQRLRRLNAPYFAMAGNHDERELIRATFADRGCLPAEGPLCYVLDHLPVRIVALDSLVEGEVQGRLGPDQLAWLDARLAEAPHEVTMVAVHHPPFAIGIGHLDRSMLEDGPAMAEVIQRHPQVERVVCGHAHRFVERRWAGTIVQIAPSASYHFQLAIGDGAPLWACEPPAVLLHYWSATSGLITHLSPIGEFSPRGRVR